MSSGSWKGLLAVRLFLGGSPKASEILGAQNLNATEARTDREQGVTPRPMDSTILQRTAL